jgi:hypothetical protein
VTIVRVIAGSAAPSGPPVTGRRFRCQVGDSCVVMPVRSGLLLPLFGELADPAMIARLSLPSRSPRGLCGFTWHGKSGRQGGHRPKVYLSGGTFGTKVLPGRPFTLIPPSGDAGHRWTR